MARYDFRCEHGHLVELDRPIGSEIPEELACTGIHKLQACSSPARRVWHAPAAIHFKGRGFYATDVQGAQERRRRPNPGDDLPREHDPAAAAIARSL